MLIDAFAGPGKFKDGSPGSPLILCQCVRKAQSAKTPLPVDVSVLAIEPERQFFDPLKYLLGNFAFATALHTTFSKSIPDIITRARTHNVFLYVDPWTVEGLDRGAMDEVFRKLKEGVSIEVLLNFNASHFVRRGLASLKMDVPEPHPDDEDPEPVDADRVAEPSSRLDAIAGGNWWRAIL